MHRNVVLQPSFSREPSVIIYVSITMLTNHALPHPSVISNVCIEVSQRIVDSLAVFRDISSFLCESRVLCAYVWSVYLYQPQGAV